jgi:hypothetical protein
VRDETSHLVRRSEEVAFVPRRSALLPWLLFIRACS